MSTASCAPWWKGSPDANTSMARSSVEDTATFMSLNLALHRTVAVMADFGQTYFGQTDFGQFQCFRVCLGQI